LQGRSKTTKPRYSCNALKTHPHSAYLAFKLAGQTRIPLLKILNIPPGWGLGARADGPLLAAFWDPDSSSQDSLCPSHAFPLVRGSPCSTLPGGGAERCALARDNMQIHPKNESASAWMNIQVRYSGLRVVKRKN